MYCGNVVCFRYVVLNTLHKGYNRDYYFYYYYYCNTGHKNMAKKLAENSSKYKCLKALFIMVSSSRPPYTTYRNHGAAATLYSWRHGLFRYIIVNIRELRSCNYFASKMLSSNSNSKMFKILQ